MKFPLNLIDRPMTLGDHLHELRRCVIWPAIALGVAFIVAIAFHAELKLLLVLPLRWAIGIVGAETAAKIGLTADSARQLQAFDLSDSTMLSMSVAFDAAVIAAFPFFVAGLWRFISIGLRDVERRLVFLFVPAAVIFFYAGAVLGFFWGLPYFFAWLIEWHVADPSARNMVLGMLDYHETFVNMTICFGLILDIPWAVMVLVRIGLVSVEQLGAWRRYVVAINVVLAAMITPTGDPYSLAAMFLPMQLLFEAGLLASRFLRPPQRGADA
jgi:sec-independent protein translocase protein TatC